MLSYLKVLVNPSDSIALRRIINVPKRGIGDATIQKVLDFAEAYELPLWDALSEVRTIPTLTARNCAGIEKFMELMENLMVISETVPVSHLIETILEDTGYIKELEASKQIEDKSRIENLKELVSDAVDFEKNYEKEKEAGSSEFDINKTQLEAYLEKVSLVQDTDKLEDEEDENKEYEYVDVDEDDIKEVYDEEENDVDIDDYNEYLEANTAITDKKRNNKSKVKRNRIRRKKEHKN